jgi:5-methylcytosine-specific restriction protein A
VSNRRKPFGDPYRTGFLRSPAWRGRRARWFRKQERLGRPLACAGCGLAATSDQLELHHLDYAGVRRAADGTWRAFEPHADLVPLHPYCHGLLHQFIERDRILSYHRDRRVASAVALTLLRAKLSNLEVSS